MERKGGVCEGHICTSGPDLDSLGEFPLHTPVRCCLAGMGRRGQVARRFVREEKVVALPM